MRVRLAIIFTVVAAFVAGGFHWQANAATQTAKAPAAAHRMHDPGCIHYCDWITNTDGERVPCGQTNEGRVEFVNQWTGEFDRCTFESPWRGRPFGYEWEVAGYLG